MRLALILLCCLFLSPGVCSAAASADQDSAQSGIGRRLELPYVAQVKEGCGSASVAMLLAYWQKHGHNPPAELLDVSAIHKAIYSPKHHGSRAADVGAFLQRVGLRTFPMRGTWSDLEEHIAQGRPLMVALRAPGGRRLHYVVVTGVSHSQVLLHDPAVSPNVLWNRQDFVRHWKASGFWTLLALPAR
jgi:ABC-type bacteriocin/lantibiotic exporter with double-glycine peptidase domain